MKIIDEYKRVTEDIAVIKSQLQRARRNLDKNVNIYKPSDLKGIDYSQERVQSSNNQPNIMEIAVKICSYKLSIDDLHKELDSLYKQRAELEKTINELGDLKKQILMLQIKGYQQWKIARELHYSQRWIEKICSEIRKECGNSTV